MDLVVQTREGKLRNAATKLKPGDIIRMQSRTAVFIHYGIAVGDGLMIHLVPKIEQNLFFGKGLYEKVNIVTYCLETDKSCEKDNSRDTREGWDPYPAWEIVERAYSKLRDSFEFYSVIFNNCEKFALWCRYRNKVGYGDQVAIGMEFVAAAMDKFGLVPTLRVGASLLGAFSKASATTPIASSSPSPARVSITAGHAATND